MFRKALKLGIILKTAEQGIIYESLRLSDVVCIVRFYDGVERKMMAIK